MQFDVAIIGGGLVGLSLARALAGSGLSLALVDRASPPQGDPQADGWDVRVYAISPGSAAFLAAHGAWPDSASDRIAAVLEMQVFGDTPGSRIVFSAYDAHVELHHRLQPVQRLQSQEPGRERHYQSGAGSRIIPPA